MKLENEKLKLNGMDESLRTFMSVPIYKIGSYTFDLDTRLLVRKTESIKLAQKETYILVCLAANINSIFLRSELLRIIWKEATIENSRSLDVYICKLRKLLSKDLKVKIICYNRTGYRLNVR
jgi:DNA-binding response OmpR family regulator